MLPALQPPNRKNDPSSEISARGLSAKEGERGWRRRRKLREGFDVCIIIFCAKRRDSLKNGYSMLHDLVPQLSDKC